MKGMRDATLQMLAQDFLLDSIEGAARRIDLGQNIDTVAIFLDHLAYAARLSLDPGKPTKTAFFSFHIHAYCIPN